MTRLRAEAPLVLFLAICAVSILTLLAALREYEREDPETKFANQAFVDKDYQEALKVYKEVSEGREDRPEPDYNSASARYKLEEYEESAEDLDRALLDAYNMDEQDLPDGLAASTQFNLGNVLFQMGEERAAVDQFGEAIGQYREAIEAYKQVLRDNPEDVDAKHNLELALRRIEEEEQQQQEQEQQQQQQQDQQQDQGDQPGSPDQPDEEGDDEQEGPEGEREGVGEDPEGEQRGDGSEQESQVPERPGVPEEQQQMTPGQALQFLEAVGQNPETLQGYLQRQFVPSSPVEKDW